MELKQILVATDGSPSALAATDVALELAAANGARVFFLHASRSLAERLFEANPEGPTREQMLEVDPVLRDAVAQAEEEGVHTEIDVIGDDGPGDLAPAILGVADACSADLVIVGSRARRPVTSAILGSTSLDVLREATVPTLVAHAPH